MAIETTGESEKKPVYTKPGVRDLDTLGDVAMGDCKPGSVAILDPRNRT